MGVVETIALVLGVFLVNALIWVAFLFWLRNRQGKAMEALRAELVGRGETVARGPEVANYRGATAEFSNVKGNCAVVLTNRRLIFRKAVGGEVVIPLSRVKSVREDSWFNRSPAGWRALSARQRSGCYQLADPPESRGEGLSR